MNYFPGIFDISCHPFTDPADVIKVYENLVSRQMADQPRYWERLNELLHLFAPLPADFNVALPMEEWMRSNPLKPPFARISIAWIVPWLRTDFRGFACKDRGEPLTFALEVRYDLRRFEWTVEDWCG